ncbi:MAG: NifU family protein [Bacteroidota bacterium]
MLKLKIETTPNPNTQKFVTNKLLTSQTIVVKSTEEAKNIPLALELFEYPFVKEVFISENYISITKDETLEWFEMQNEIGEFLEKYLQSEKQIISKNNGSKHVNLSIEEKDDNTSKQIVSILDKYIKPAVARDGGNIQFESYDQESKVVNVTLQGACNGCPSATVTLKNGVEAALKHFLGDKIECVNALK